MKHRRPCPDLRHQREAIMDKVDLCSEINLVTGCWEWIKHRNALGYAQTCWGNRQWIATRLIYCAIHGAFDKNLDICHSCDNPGCVNPEHIRVDEHRANLLDASKRKRLQGQWKTHCSRGHPLSGDNLYRQSKFGFRSCKKCHTARYRMKRYGWPEHLAYSDIRVPKGYMIDKATGAIISGKGRQRKPSCQTTF